MNSLARLLWRGWHCFSRGDLPEADLELIEERRGGLSSHPTRLESTCYSAWQAFGTAGDRITKAAQCAREANDLARAQLERRNRSYQPDEHERLVSALIGSVDRPFFARLSGAGTRHDSPCVHRRPASVGNDVD